MFVVKRGEYFRKYNIFEVDFDSGVCISMGWIHKKIIHDFPPKFYSSNLNFCAKITENGTKWPPLSWDMPTVLSLGITAVFRSCNVLCYVVSSTCSNAEISGTQRTPCMVFSLPWQLYEVPAARILLLESLFSFIFGRHHTYKLYKISW